MTNFREFQIIDIDALIFLVLFRKRRRLRFDL